MEEVNEFLDDYFYPLDFEDEFEHEVDLEKILEGAHGNTREFACTLTFGETFSKM